MESSPWNFELTPNSPLSFDGLSAFHVPSASFPFTRAKNSMIVLCGDVVFYCNGNILYYSNTRGDLIGQHAFRTNVIRLSALTNGVIAISQNFISIFAVDKYNITLKCEYSNGYKNIKEGSVIPNKQTVLYLHDAGIFSMTWPKMEMQTLLTFEDSDERWVSIKKLIGEETITTVIGISVSSFICISESKIFVVTSKGANLMDVTIPNVKSCCYGKSRLFVETKDSFHVFEHRITKIRHLEPKAEWKIPNGCDCLLNQTGAAIVNNKTCLIIQWPSDMPTAKLQRILFGSNFLSIGCIENGLIISRTYGGYVFSHAPRGNEEVKLITTKYDDGIRTEIPDETKEVKVEQRQPKEKEKSEEITLKEIKPVKEDIKENITQINNVVLMVRSDNQPTESTTQIYIENPEDESDKRLPQSQPNVVLEDKPTKKVKDTPLTPIQVITKSIQEEDNAMERMRKDRERLEQIKIEQEKKRAAKKKKSSNNATNQSRAPSQNDSKSSSSISALPIIPIIEEKQILPTVIKQTQPIQEVVVKVKTPTKEIKQKENRTGNLDRNKLREHFAAMDNPLEKLNTLSNRLETTPYCYDFPDVLRKF
ncbi:CNH domain-containing protein [Entamoeba marina]